MGAVVALAVRVEPAGPDDESGEAQFGGRVRGEGGVRVLPNVRRGVGVSEGVQHDGVDDDHQLEAVTLERESLLGAP